MFVEHCIGSILHAGLQTASWLKIKGLNRKKWLSRQANKGHSTGSHSGAHQGKGSKTQCLHRHVFLPYLSVEAQEALRTAGRKHCFTSMVCTFCSKTQRAWNTYLQSTNKITRTIWPMVQSILAHDILHFKVRTWHKRASEQSTMMYNGPSRSCYLILLNPCPFTPQDRTMNMEADSIRKWSYALMAPNWENLKMIPKR